MTLREFIDNLVTECKVHPNYANKQVRFATSPFNTYDCLLSVYNDKKVVWLDIGNK